MREKVSVSDLSNFWNTYLNGSYTEVDEPKRELPDYVDVEDPFQLRLKLDRILHDVFVDAENREFEMKGRTEEDIYDSLVDRIENYRTAPVIGNQIHIVEDNFDVDRETVLDYIDDDFRSYAENKVQDLNNKSLKPRCQEVELRNSDLRGRADILEDNINIIDVKTGEPRKKDHFQVAAYAVMMDQDLEDISAEILYLPEFNYEVVDAEKFEKHIWLTLDYFDKNEIKQKSTEI